MKEVTKMDKELESTINNLKDTTNLIEKTPEQIRDEQDKIWTERLRITMRVLITLLVIITVLGSYVTFNHNEIAGVRECRASELNNADTKECINGVEKANKKSNKQVIIESTVLAVLLLPFTLIIVDTGKNKSVELSNTLTNLEREHVSESERISIEHGLKGVDLLNATRMKDIQQKKLNDQLRRLKKKLNRTYKEAKRIKIKAKITKLETIPVDSIKVRNFRPDTLDRLKESNRMLSIRKNTNNNPKLMDFIEKEKTKRIFMAFFGTGLGSVAMYFIDKYLKIVDLWHVSTKIFPILLFIAIISGLTYITLYFKTRIFLEGELRGKIKKLKYINNIDPSIYTKESQKAVKSDSNASEVCDTLEVDELD